MGGSRIGGYGYGILSVTHTRVGCCSMPGSSALLFAQGERIDSLEALEFLRASDAVFIIKQKIIIKIIPYEQFLGTQS